MRLITSLLAILCFQSATADSTDDPHLWLEEVEGEQALDWVRSQNAATFSQLTENSLYDQLYEEALAILTSEERIPQGQIVGDEWHNFWQDEQHVRGVWRSTPLKRFIDGKPEWTNILSIDALVAEEGQNWVYQGIDCLGGDSDRCLVELSIGGKDESVRREFSLSTQEFVDDGFYVPEAKSFVTWLSEDELLVATEWGEDSLTLSGYPRQLRLWQRGTQLDDASLLMEIDREDTLVAPVVFHSNGDAYPFALRYFADWNENTYTPIVDGDVTSTLPIPLRASLDGILDGHGIVSLEQAWTVGEQTFKSGDLVALDLEDATIELVYSPAAREAVSSVSISANGILLEMLDNVVGTIKRLSQSDDGWQSDAIALPQNGVALLSATSSSRDDLFVTFENSVQPTTLYHVAENNDVTAVTSIAPLYDSTDVVIRQHFATSADGTRVPYFLVGHKDILEHGNAPAILYGYGGFQIPILPVYYADPSRPQHGALAGRMWISRGGVLALANLRGGGEFGPEWHKSALRENRQRAYDDYFAIAEDMIANGVTSADRLGALGRSNGGLLLGVALTQRPDLFAALDIGVPLLDMKRYSKLLAGSSWMGEYGNPDVAEDWQFIKQYSPYQNLAKGKDYPTVLFYTSTKDDRVHPGHARKMAAELDALGHDFFYYENIEGGHGGTANQDQLAKRTALEYAYFVRMLMPGVWDSEPSN